MSFQTSKEYSECTPREKKWLDVYLTPEDHAYLNINEATIVAFEISPDNSLAYGRSVLARPRIKKLVEQHTASTALPTLDEFKLELWKTAQTENKDARIKLGALTLYADISGWRTRTLAKSAKSGDDNTFDPLSDITYEAETNSEKPTSSREA